MAIYGTQPRSLLSSPERKRRSFRHPGGLPLAFRVGGLLDDAIASRVRWQRQKSSLHGRTTWGPTNAGLLQWMTTRAITATDFGIVYTAGQFEEGFITKSDSRAVTSGCAEADPSNNPTKKFCNPVVTVVVFTCQVFLVVSIVPAAQAVATGVEFVVTCHFTLGVLLPT